MSKGYACAVSHAVAPNQDRTLMCMGSSSGRVAVFYKSFTQAAEFVGDTAMRIHSAPVGDKTSFWAPSGSWVANEGEEVTALAWLPQKFGDLVAVGTAAGSVSLWRRENASIVTWSRVAALEDTALRITTLAFAPAQHGKILAAGSTDGYLRIYAAETPGSRQEWGLAHVLNPGMGSGGVLGPDAVTGVAWRPAGGVAAKQLALASTTSPAPHADRVSGPVPIDAGGSCAIWAYHQGLGRWERVHTASRGACGAVAWAGQCGRDYEALAVAHGSDVRIAALRGSLASLQCTELQVLRHDRPVWDVQWDSMGLDLACSVEGGSTAVWELRLDGKWAPMLDGEGVSPEWISKQEERVRSEVVVEDMAGE